MNHPLKISSSKISGLEKDTAAFSLLIAYAAIFVRLADLMGLFWFFLKQFRPHREEQGKLTCKEIYIYIYKMMYIPSEKMRVAR